MKLYMVFFAAMVASASASEMWMVPPDDGEIARQFPKHASVHIYPPTNDNHVDPSFGIRSIGIQRTACYGECPVYTLIVKSDGTFRYHGERYTKRRGNWHGIVDSGRLWRVLRYASEMNFFVLEDLYSNYETDLPGTFTLVKTRTRKKIIYDYGYLGPAKLVAFEDMIDHLLDGVKWKRD